MSNVTTASSNTNTSLSADSFLKVLQTLQKQNNKKQAITNSLSGIGSFLGGMSGSDIPQGDLALREGLRSTIGKMGPWGAAISAASGAVDAIGDFTNTNLSSIDIDSAERAGIKGSAIFNKAMNMLPGNSMLLGIFGKNTNKANMSAQAQSLGSSYGGAMQTLNDAQKLGNKRMLFGVNKANKFINNANEINSKLTHMAMKQQRMENNYLGQLTTANNALSYQGLTPGLSFSKKGGTIPELDEVRSIMQSLQSKKQEIQEPQKFQLGGKMNMIVTGALHARKHNLEELNPNLEGEITKKGIPVVTFDEGGEVDQQLAEVESQELVLQIDTTKTIEDYYDEYNSTNSKTEKNKIALECGKYLVDELLKNTDDPDKLIKKTV